MIAYVQNGIIVEEPQVAPVGWKNPVTGETVSHFRNLSLADIFALGWKEVVDTPLAYNPLFEQLVIGSWYYDVNNDIVTRDYTVEALPFINSVTNVVKVIATNRETYCLTPFLYTSQLMGMDVKVFSDLKSRGDLNVAYLKAVNGTRLENDVFSFLNSSNAVVVLPVSNVDIMDIGDFLYRKVQDAYNISADIYWQILGCGTTPVLKEQILNGNINLNPWVV